MKQLFKRLSIVVVAALITQVFRHTLQQQESATKTMILIGIAVTAAWLATSVLATLQETRYGALYAFCVSLGVTVGMVIALSH